MTLKESLQLSSEKIWEEMKPVDRRFKINQVREEGLTSMVLKCLANSNCLSIQKIIESPKQGKESEKFLGYDYDLWIGNKNKYVRYIIQAKSQGDNYSLDSRYTINGIQLSRLERFAITSKKAGIPLYAYYKHLTVPDVDLKEYYNSKDSFRREYLGITLSTSSKVKKSETITFAQLHTFTNRIENWIPLFEKNPEDIRFYNEMLNATVPWHELSSFKISTVEAINTTFTRIKKLETLFLFLLIPPFFDFGGNLIPVHNITPTQIENFCFNKKVSNSDTFVYDPIRENFQGRSLIILDCGE